MTSTELKHQANLQKWATEIRDCRSSGLSVRQWCKQKAITPTTYYRWERELLSLAHTELEGNYYPADIENIQKMYDKICEKEQEVQKAYRENTRVIRHLLPR